MSEIKTDRKICTHLYKENIVVKICINCGTARMKFIYLIQNLKVEGKKQWWATFSNVKQDIKYSLMGQ